MEASAGPRDRVTSLMDADELRATFDSPAPFTVGIEEEVFLLDPAGFELAERAAELLARLGGPGHFKLELPAAQLELVTRPHGDVPAAIAELADARRELLAGADGLVVPAGAGVHPFSPGEGTLNPGPRYERTEARRDTRAGGYERKLHTCSGAQ